MKDLLNKNNIILALSIVICVIWSYLFWWLFIIKFSAEYLHVPIGLGGAIYYVFFLPPVLLGSCIYELLVYKFILIKELKVFQKAFFALILPIIIITLLLIIFCPMDIEAQYIDILFLKLKEGI